MKRLLLIILLIIQLTTFAQNNKIEFNFLPSGLHFIPLKANFREARIGVMIYGDNADLKVDIGNNIDLLDFQIPAKKMRLTLGIEFMAYALATDYNGLHLQIDALDGFFGGNASFSSGENKDKFIARLRIIHNSAHFVDGHYDLEKNVWINGKKPFPFTRDFGELLIGKYIEQNNYKMRFYITPTYSTLVRPMKIQKWSLSGGFEIANDNIIDKIFEHPTNLYIAVHTFLMGMPKYQLTTNFMGGIKFGEWNGKGVSFYLSYYVGNNIFSEYFYNRISRLGVGFFVDFN